MELTIEQQFKIRSFNDQADTLSREQAIELLKEMHRQSLIRETFWLSQLKGSELGILGLGE